MKRLLIVVALLLLIGGGGGATVYFMELGPFAPEGGTDEEALDPIAEGPVPIYVNMTPISIPVLDGDTVVTTLQIQVSLQVTEENKEDVTHNLPRLNDAFLRDLYVYLPRVLRRNPRLDILSLKKHLNRVAARALGEGKIEEVLVQSVLETESF